MKSTVAILCLIFSSSVFAQESAHTWDRLAVRQDLFARESEPLSTLDGFSVRSETISGKKNVGLAVLYSLILPGMGELYVGEYGIGKYFTTVEAGLWLTYGSFEWYGTWLRDDARKFAALRAGVDPMGKSDQFFVDIGNFMNTNEYNAKKLRDREPDKLYDVHAGYFWQWESDEQRAAYREMRISHDRVFNNARFVGAAIIVNHIVSAINAARLAVSYNKNVEASGLLNLRARVIQTADGPDGVMITVSRGF